MTVNLEILYRIGNGETHCQYAKKEGARIPEISGEEDLDRAGYTLLTPEQDEAFRRVLQNSIQPVMRRIGETYRMSELEVLVFAVDDLVPQKGAPITKFFDDLERVERYFNAIQRLDRLNANVSAARSQPFSIYHDPAYVQSQVDSEMLWAAGQNPSLGPSPVAIAWKDKPSVPAKDPIEIAKVYDAAKYQKVQQFIRGCVGSRPQVTPQSAFQPKVPVMQPAARMDQLEESSKALRERFQRLQASGALVDLAKRPQQRMTQTTAPQPKAFSPSQASSVLMTGFSQGQSQVSAEERLAQQRKFYKDGIASGTIVDLAQWNQQRTTKQ
ncbi:MAG: hypothetical protein FJZ63_00310 [Chlamydiae bacterium]|nr:hypothetical protein [Chlamydiota bacterium]